MKSKIDRIKELVGKIKADCQTLRLKGTLSERGRGQLDTINLIEEILKE